jgi:hypothetical protein
MHELFVRFRPVIRFAVRRAAWVLILATALTVAGVWLAGRLAIDTDLANLIPENYESVKALERLRETVGAEEEAAVAIVSPSFAANRAFAEALIPEVLALRGERYDEPYFARVDYRRDVTFLESNALYFATDPELDELENWLEGKVEEARLEANPFFFDLEEEDDAEPDSVAESLRDTYDRIVSKEYPVSDDSTTLVLRLYPTGSQTDIGFIESAYGDLERLIDRLNPETWHPDMEITLAGRLQRRLVEVDTIRRDVFGSFGSGVSAVLLLVILYFAYKAYVARVGHRIVGRVLLAEFARLPVMALVIGVPLLMSLSWTFGLAELIYDDLNLMTSTLGLVLFGLGIDFGIHFYARYSEERASGQSVVDAAERTFLGTGQAITVGALTTAMALYVLVVADFRGFSQFGFIAGTGILFALVAMMVVLPALLSVLERLRLLNLEAREGHSSWATPSGRAFPGVRTVLFVSILVSAAAAVASTRVGFEYDFGRLEPVYEEYNARRDIVQRVSSDRNRRNPAYIVVDDAADIGAVTTALREHIVADTLTPTIDRVESLQDRFPVGPAEQARRLGRLGDIRTLLADPLLSTDASEDMQRLRRATSTTEPIPVEHVPEFLSRQFTDKNGEIGRFVIIYPSVGLSDGRNSIAFSEDVGTITTGDGSTFHAGSSSIVAADMLRLMRAETPWMVGATFVIVLLLMFVNFGSVRWTLLAVVPLVVGVLWMLFLVEVFGLRLNFYNMIVMPAVLGIGNDAGVHMVHRYRELGPGSIRAVLRSTGEHVTMGSLTTMLGFAGLLLSFHPGLESIGHLAIVGIGSTLAAALIFLPALLQWLENRGGRTPERAPAPRGEGSDSDRDGRGRSRLRNRLPAEE